MIQKTRVLRASGCDPYVNLAAEEALLRGVAPGEATLFLWQNRHTVVIGAGQNAWRECDTARLERDGGKLARRSSGGGAVYHDLGNLNFSFLVPREDYDVSRQLGVVLSAARALGVDAEATGRNDLTVEGRKFSGNAFRLLKESALHHGTLLVSADMENIAKYLSVDPEKLRAKGVKSVKSRVINLCERADVTVENMALAMERAFCEEYGYCEAVSLDDADLAEFDDLLKKYKSWEWNYGRSPAADWRDERRFSWGGVELNSRVEGGIMLDVEVYTDAMDETLHEKLAGALEGCPFEPEHMASRARALGLYDVAEWLAGSPPS